MRKLVYILVAASVCAAFQSFALDDPDFKGMMLKPYVGKIIALRNRQTKFSAAELEEQALYFRWTYGYPMFVIGGTEVRKDTGIEITLVDSAFDPSLSLIAAPEQFKAYFATGMITADAPDHKRRELRMRLELHRAIALACGAGIANYQPCIMAPIHSTADIDRMASREPGPECINNLEAGFRKAGIGKALYQDYQQACQEGWAPAPTNDVQKAIWDKVHEIPSKPIKIEFDPKKGR